MRELLALVEGRAGTDVRLAARVAEGHAMLAELATHSGNPEAGAELFARAAAEFIATGLPWFAVEYEARLAGLAHQLGDMREAERALRAALEHGGPYLEAVGRAQLHLQLAEVVGGRGRPKRPRNTPWRRRTGRTRRVRAPRSARGRGTSSAGSW